MKGVSHNAWNLTDNKCSIVPIISILKSTLPLVLIKNLDYLIVLSSNIFYHFWASSSSFLLIFLTHRRNASFLSNASILLSSFSFSTNTVYKIVVNSWYGIRNVLPPLSTALLSTIKTTICSEEHNFKISCKEFPQIKLLLHPDYNSMTQNDKTHRKPKNWLWMRNSR